MPATPHETCQLCGCTTDQHTPRTNILQCDTCGCITPDTNTPLGETTPTTTPDGANRAFCEPLRARDTPDASLAASGGVVGGFRAFARALTADGTVEAPAGSVGPVLVAPFWDVSVTYLDGQMARFRASSTADVRVLDGLLTVTRGALTHRVPLAGVRSWTVRPGKRRPQESAA